MSNAPKFGRGISDRRTMRSLGRRRSPSRDRTRDERGSVAVELTLVTPLLLLLLLFVVALGRLADGRLQVGDAASQAARAATVVDSVGGASSTAREAAAASLQSDNVTCSSLSVSTDNSSFQPGGVVRVTVACTVSLSDLSLLHVPGAETLTATASSPVDQFRSTGS
jgi:Flp pilus assembly protein TadG